MLPNERFSCQCEILLSKKNVDDYHKKTNEGQTTRTAVKGQSVYLSKENECYQRIMEVIKGQLEVMKR